VTFSPDNRTVISGGQENTAYLWDVPSMIDAPIREVERSIQAATGMELLDDGSLHILDTTGWNERRVRTD
jgi:eukaryotic-like serine/threonine-protein kinase